MEFQNQKNMKFRNNETLYRLEGRKPETIKFKKQK